MGKVSIDEQVFTNIADAIRDRNEELTTYKPREMSEAIKDLHNIIPKKWIRPSNWPDYSQVDLTGQEVIYLTYDCTFDDMWISIRCYGDYTVVRGSISNGVFTASSTATNKSSGTVFQEKLPTNEGNYVVYKITPQSGASLTRFAFARRDVDSSAIYVTSWVQPCVERYCRLPNWIGTANRSNHQYTWSTRYLIADTIMDASPINLISAYNDGGHDLTYVDMSTCSFASVINMDSVFYNQYNISEIYLPHDLSDLCTKLNATFYNCFELIYLDLSGWDTSGVSIFSNMFYECRELVEIKGIEDFDFTAATNMGSMFYDNRNLKLNESITSKWTTSSALIAINSLFYNCFSIVNLDVSKFNTSKVTNFSYVFYGCVNLKEIDIRNWSITSEATTLVGLFGYCRKLEKIKRTKNWDVSNVTSFEAMFRECFLLEEFDFSDFEPEKVTNVRYMFQHCYTLSKIDMDGMDLTTITNKTNVQDFATYCLALRDLKLPDTTYMPGVGYNYWAIKIKVPDTVTNMADNCLRSLEQCELIDCTDASSVIALAATTDITNGWNNKIRIAVPDNLYSSWSGATNWSNNTLAWKIVKKSDWDLYIGENSATPSTIDLSQCSWTSNSSYSQSAAAGTAYASMISNASNGKRIISGLIDVPDTGLVITVNDGYQFSALYYDANGNYLKEYFEWYRGGTVLRWSSIKKIALVVRIGDGTNTLAPADWADSGISVKYISGN